MELYLGLVLISGFVLYDTQMIIERCRQGDNDFIKYSPFNFNINQKVY